MIALIGKKRGPVTGLHSAAVLLLLAAAATGAWAGGAREKAPAASRPAFAGSVVMPDQGAVVPIEKASRKPLKIAVIGSQDVPLWNSVEGAIQKAEGELEAVNCTVDLLAVGGMIFDTYGGALKSAVGQKYDAIAMVALEPGLVPAINAAVDAGIPVATFAGESAEESKRVFFVGPDYYEEGQAAAARVASLLDGKGRVVVITGLFATGTDEQRRKGFEDSLAQNTPGLTVVGQVEDREKDSMAYHEAQDFLASDPLLSAIYVTDGGAPGVAKAVGEAGKAGRVKVVCFDTSDETMEYVKQGVVAGTFREDVFALGHDPAIRLYNYLVGGVVPPAGRLVTQAEFVTKDNIDQFYKGKPGG